MKTINPTPMKTPTYQKIPGEKLTNRQAMQVLDALAPKYGAKMPRWLDGRTFWFCPSGKRFLEVFADA